MVSISCYHLIKSLNNFWAKGVAPNASPWSSHSSSFHPFGLHSTLPLDSTATSLYSGLWASSYEYKKSFISFFSLHMWEWETMSSGIKFMYSWDRCDEMFFVFSRNVQILTWWFNARYILLLTMIVDRHRYLQYFIRRSFYKKIILKHSNFSLFIIHVMRRQKYSINNNSRRAICT